MKNLEHWQVLMHFIADSAVNLLLVHPFCIKICKAEPYTCDQFVCIWCFSMPGSFVWLS